MTNDEWFDWQMRLLFEQVERLAECLRLQLSLAETLVEDAQAWFFSTPCDTPMRPGEAVRATPPAPQAREFSSPLSPSAPQEIRMRGMEEIIADVRKALNGQYREAFDSGQYHAASETRRRVEASFEGSAGPAGAHDGEIATSPRRSADHDPKGQ